MSFYQSSNRIHDSKKLKFFCVNQGRPKCDGYKFLRPATGLEIHCEFLSMFECFSENFFIFVKFAVAGFFKHKFQIIFCECNLVNKSTTS